MLFRMAYQMSECFLYEPSFKTQLGNSRPLQDGDIVNIDVTIYLNSYHGDTSATFLVGDVVRKFLIVRFYSWWFTRTTG